MCCNHLAKSKIIKKHNFQFPLLSIPLACYLLFSLSIKFIKTRFAFTEFMEYLPHKCKRQKCAEPVHIQNHKRSSTSGNCGICHLRNYLCKCPTLRISLISIKRNRLTHTYSKFAQTRNHTSKFDSLSHGLVPETFHFFQPWSMGPACCHFIKITITQRDMATH